MWRKISTRSLVDVILIFLMSISESYLSLKCFWKSVCDQRRVLDRIIENNGMILSILILNVLLENASLLQTLCGYVVYFISFIFDANTKLGVHHCTKDVPKEIFRVA